VSLVVALILAASSPVEPPPAPDAQLAPADLAPRHSRARLLALDFGAGAAAAVVAVPVSLALANWIGQLSPDNFVSGLPALVLFVTLPALAITLSEWWISNHLEPGSARVRPAIWAALGAQFAVWIVGALLGAGIIDLPSIIAFTLCDAILVPGVVTGVFYLKGTGAPPPVPVGIRDPSYAAPPPAARLTFAF